MANNAVNSGSSVMNRNIQDRLCYDTGCRFHGKEHYHVMTNDGGYAKFIVPKPPVDVDIKEITDNADTWR